MKGAVMRKGRLYEMGSYTQRGLRGVHKKGGCMKWAVIRHGVGEGGVYKKGGYMKRAVIQKRG